MITLGRGRVYCPSENLQHWEVAKTTKRLWKAVVAGMLGKRSCLLNEQLPDTRGLQSHYKYIASEVAAKWCTTSHINKVRDKRNWKYVHTHSLANDPGLSGGGPRSDKLTVKLGDIFPDQSNLLKLWTEKSSKLIIVTQHFNSYCLYVTVSCEYMSQDLFLHICAFLALHVPPLTTCHKLEHVLKRGSFPDAILCIWSHENSTSDMLISCIFQSTRTHTRSSW